MPSAAHPIEGRGSMQDMYVTVEQGDDRGYDRRTEVESLLADDDTALGRLWRYQIEGLSPQEMTAREGIATTGWVSNYRPLIRALRDDEVPSSPTISQAARRARSWLKKLGIRQS
jgi:hypothetical protein